MPADPVTRVATIDRTDMPEPGSPRRMPLPGFAEEFVDFPHFILRITDRIWHDRHPELCREWYAADCLVHTPTGDIAGVEPIVENTAAMQAAFPDRHLYPDNVIWSTEGEGSFYSSHRITSRMTHVGAGEWGPPTGRTVRFATVADCLCRGNRIVEEWLIRDALALTRQLGLDVDEQVARLARSLDPRSVVRGERGWRARARPEPEGAERVAAEAVKAMWCDASPAGLRKLCDCRVRAMLPGNEATYGLDELTVALAPLRDSLDDRCFSIDHACSVTYLGEARDVALRWCLTGVHAGGGRLGEPCRQPLFVPGMAHLRLIGGRVAEIALLWDVIAVRAQIEAWRLVAPG